MTKLAKREPTALEVRRRKALAQVSAMSAFCGAGLSVGVMALILLAAGSLHVPLWSAIVFCMVVSTVGGYLFGRQSARMLPEGENEE